MSETAALDRFLAEKVMGWSLTGVNWYVVEHLREPKWTGYSTQYLHTCEHSIWRPSDEIAQAMMVAEKIGDMNLCTGTQSYACFHNGPMWQAETPALAICLAAKAWLEAR